MKIRTAEPEDISAITDLYRRVARENNGLARKESEINTAYVKDFVEKSIASGLILVAEHPEEPDRLVGEMHAYKPGPAVFGHVLSQLTIAVDPLFQSKKIGRTLFTIFQEEIALNRPDIGRVELMAMEHNEKAIAFYQSLGFIIEGRMEMRVRTADNQFQADIPMSWQNPNFEFD